MNNLFITVLFATAFVLTVVETATVVQCNLGLKMYSVESGNAICAPLSPSFKCIEACEWNTSCALTSHFTAFRGKRSYVAGMVLTNATFLVQCCASLATIVQTNAQQEPTCVWVPDMETVEERGTVRFDPPLSSNEYIREMLIQRKGNGQVSVKAQICKYTVQRTNCDREEMSPEESRFYSLLLLRLSRTKAFLSSGNKTSSKTGFGGSFRDESPLANFRSLAKHAPANTNPSVLSQRTTIRNIATTVAGEAGGDLSGVADKMPMPSFPWKPDASSGERPPSRNAMAAISHVLTIYTSHPVVDRHPPPPLALAKQKIYH
uniref:Uncharacterized protein n=1 Tax=Ditylenchus dipsaci TaxID=166011 RepID=A0A915D5Y2_9BILA